MAVLVGLRSHASTFSATFAVLVGLRTFFLYRGMQLGLFRFRAGAWLHHVEGAVYALEPSINYAPKFLRARTPLPQVVCFSAVVCLLLLHANEIAHVTLSLAWSQKKVRTFPNSNDNAQHIKMD